MFLYVGRYTPDRSSSTDDEKKLGDEGVHPSDIPLKSPSGSSNDQPDVHRDKDVVPVVQTPPQDSPRSEHKLEESVLSIPPSKSKCLIGVHR